MHRGLDHLARPARRGQHRVHGEADRQAGRLLRQRLERVPAVRAGELAAVGVVCEVDPPKRIPTELARGGLEEEF